ncbi:hypothetical protein Btru_031950 [Bulinus truncatus]|nr:hypothetical protein Btru_031950 [Bulinus truncatus]
MAATSAVRGDQESESGPCGTQNNNMPLKAEKQNETVKNTSLTEKQSCVDENGKPLKEKTVKDDSVPKKFVDAPLPATNAWAKRSASLSTDTHPAQTIAESKEVAEKVSLEKQTANTSHKPTKTSKNTTANHEKQRPDKPKTDSNGSKTPTPPEVNPKPKIKKFGDDYVEAPLPAVNPWKRPSGTNVSSPFNTDQDPTPAAARSKETKPPLTPPFSSADAACALWL